MVFRQLIPQERVITFREAMKIAAQEVDRSKIGYIGLVGTSLERDMPVHDLDVLVFPEVGAGVGESIVAMNELYKTLDRVLERDHSLYLAPCAKKIMQAEVNHIIGGVKGTDRKLSTHTLFFPDSRSYKAFNPVDFANSVARHSETVLGDPSCVTKRPNAPQKRLEPYFLIADYQVPLVEGKYPDKLVLEKTEEIVDYLAKHYGIRARLPRRASDCGRLVEDILVGLDKAA